MSEDEKAIRALVEEWMSATRAGDVDAVMELMTDDVLFTVVGQEPFGKEAFKKAAGESAGMQIDGHSNINEVTVLDGWAFLRNYIEVTVAAPEAGPIERSGYTLTILRKGSDGQWRVCRDANLLTTKEA